MKSNESTKRNVFSKLFNKLVKLDIEANNKYCFIGASIMLIISIAISYILVFCVGKIYLSDDEVNELKTVANEIFYEELLEELPVIISDDEEFELTDDYGDKFVRITKSKNELSVRVSNEYNIRKGYVKIIKDSEGNVEEIVDSCTFSAICFVLFSLFLWVVIMFAYIIFIDLLKKLGFGSLRNI